MTSLLRAIIAIETFMPRNTIGTPTFLLPDAEAIDAIIRKVAREEILEPLLSAGP